MSVNQVGSPCKLVTSLRAKVCKSCGCRFGTQKKYKVVVKGLHGKRTTKVIDTLITAKKYESKLKTQLADNRLFGITEVPIIDDVWKKYLPWAKQNKKILQQLTVTREIVGMIPKEQLIQYFMIAYIVLLLCWWGFALYIHMRWQYFLLCKPSHLLSRLTSRSQRE